MTPAMAVGRWLAIATIIYLISSAWALSCRSAEPEPRVTLFDRLSDSGWSLHKSLSGVGAGQGASFSATKESGSSGSYSTQFALENVTKIGRILAGEMEHFFTLDMSAAGSLQTNDTKRTNFLDFRPQFGHQFVWDRARPLDYPSFFTRFGPLLENSKDFDVKNLLFEIETAPSYGPLAMSQAQQIAPGVYFVVQPLLNFQVGGNLNHKAITAESQHQRLRVIPKLGGTLYFPDLASALGFNQISLTLEDQFAYLPLETMNHHNYFDASLDFDIVKSAVSLGFSYERGSQAPFYQADSKFMAQIKIKFGAGFIAPSYPTP